MDDLTRQQIGDRLWDGDLVDRIQAIRSRNNEHWMNLLRLALKAAPSEARHILAQIAENDQQVITLTKRISRASD